MLLVQEVIIVKENILVYFILVAIDAVKVVVLHEEDSIYVVVFINEVPKEQIEKNN